MQKSLFYFIFIIGYLTTATSVSAQNNITGVGNFITNIYSAEIYQAHSQNWAIAQDSAGRMYFGNSNGMLVYNGIDWRTFGVRNNSIVRSLHLFQDRMYVGAQNEFGYFEPDSLGRLHYHSLSDLIADTTIVFNDIWTVHGLDSVIYFLSSNYLFLYTNNKIEIIKAKGAYSAIYEIDNKLYVYDSGLGLSIYTNSNKQLIIPAEDNFKVRIYFMLPKKDGAIWLGTREMGIVELKGKTITPVKTEADEYFKENSIYLSSKYNATTFLISTLRGGLVLLDTSGTVKRILTKKDGLTDDAVYRSFTDREGNIWLVHENGITRIEINSPLTLVKDEQYLTSLPFAISKFQNQLLISVNSGLYAYVAMNDKLKKNAESNFQSYIDEPNRIWCIESDNNQLIMAGQGLILIKENNTISKIFENIHVWKIEPIKGYEKKFWVFTTEGIHRLEYIANKWTVTPLLDGFSINSRYNTIDAQGNIWVAENLKGIFQIRPDANLKLAQVKNFGKESGINNMNTPRCVSLGDDIYVSAGNNIYKYDKLNELFNKVHVFNDLSDSITSDLVFRYTQPGENGIWCNYESQVAFLYKKNDSLFLETQPYKIIPKMNLLPTFYSDTSELFVGYPKQLFRFDKKFRKDYNQNFKIIITGIVDLKSDTIFADQFFDFDHSLNMEFEFKYNSLRFSFAAPFFQRSEANQFSYMLVGQDNGWSQYSSSVYKDYTNLTEGRYAFMVKARNVFGIETEPAVVYFTIDPPFYRHTLAYFVYTLLAILLIYIIVKLNTRTLKRTNTELEKRVEMRTQKIFEQKEELRKQNNELTKLSAIASETSNAVSVFNQSGNLEWINDGFIKMYGYTLEELIYNADSNITSFCPPYIAEAILKRKQAEYESFSYEMQRNTKQNTKLWVKSTLTPLFDDLGNLYSIIAIDTDISELKIAESIIINAKDEIQTQRDELIHQNKFIQMQNDDIQAAIRYAKTIQEAILPAQTVLDEFYDNFIIYIPKDIVSGDFYWFHSMVLEREIKLETQNEKKQILELKPNTRLDFLIVADFTGHGVPGAFMSLIGSQLFTEIIIEKKEYLPSQILNLINQDIRKALKQDITNNTDGMDVGICLLIHTADSTPVIYAGSKRPFYIRKSSNMELLKTKGDSSSIGGYYTRVDADFTDFVTELNDNDVIYMSSDGFIDQNGEKRKRYGSPRFEILLKEIGNKTMPDQKQIFLQELREFMSDLPQRDDITLIGIKKHSPK